MAGEAWKIPVKSAIGLSFFSLAAVRTGAGAPINQINHGGDGDQPGNSAAEGGDQQQTDPVGLAVLTNFSTVQACFCGLFWALFCFHRNRQLSASSFSQPKKQIRIADSAGPVPRSWQTLRPKSKPIPKGSKNGHSSPGIVSAGRYSKEVPKWFRMKRGWGEKGGLGRI